MLICHFHVSILHVKLHFSEILLHCSCSHHCDRIHCIVSTASCPPATHHRWHCRCYDMRHDITCDITRDIAYCHAFAFSSYHHKWCHMRHDITCDIAYCLFLLLRIICGMISPVISHDDITRDIAYGHFCFFFAPPYVPENPRFHPGRKKRTNMNMIVVCR